MNNNPSILRAALLFTIILHPSSFILSARAQVPQLLHYQGRAIGGGTNFEGTGQFKFALVDQGLASQQATATVSLFFGGVALPVVANHGYGYTSAPAVSFAGGGGSGASAHAVVFSGRVTTLVIDNPGGGYFDAPAVTIDPPPAGPYFRTYWSNDGSSTAGHETTSAIALPVSKGLYALLLGDTNVPNMTAIPTTVFANSDVRLRVWFNDGTHGFQQVSPDQRIAAVGYAMIASSVDDGAITSSKLAAGAATSDKLAAGAVTAGKLAAGAVGSTQIANGAVGSAQLAAEAVTTDKLAAGAVGAPQIGVGAILPGHLDAGIGLWTAFGSNVYRAGGNVGIGTSTPTASLEVAGQIKITGGAPGSGKILMSDADGLAGWQSPSALSVFFGQHYSALIPDVIDNTVTLEIAGITDDPAPRVVIVNGPGLQIQRVLGFAGTNHDDQPGPNMEFPLVFEYGGSQTNILAAWFQTLQTIPDYRAGSIIYKNLAGAETGRWNFYEMALTQIEPGTDGRQRYTLHHTLPPDNILGYQRDWDFPANPSKNPATDTDRVEIESVNQGGYPVIQIDTNNRTITLTFDYTEAGEIFRWVRDTATGQGSLWDKRPISVIRENANGMETGRRNYWGTFPIEYQQFTGFGQDIKLKERVVISYDSDTEG